MELMDMRFVNKRSIYYRIIGGRHRGMFCAVLDWKVLPNGLMSRMKVARGKTRIAFLNPKIGGGQIIFEKVKYLLQRELPGWDDRVPDNGVDFETFLEEHGNGSNRLRTKFVAQPHTLRQGDFLATGTRIIAGQRLGVNSSILLKLSKFGWVELASRLPIALSGSKNKTYKMPIDLRKGDILATTCKTDRPSDKLSDEWTKIHIDNTSILVPSCVPIALKIDA